MRVWIKNLYTPTCLAAGAVAASLLFTDDNRSTQNGKSSKNTDYEESSYHHSMRETAEAKARQVISRYKAERGLAGVSVGVSVNNERTPWTHAEGYSDLENLAPMKPESLIRIASISKPITMAMVAKAVENGHIDLDAPIQKYVSDFPKKQWTGKAVDIKIRHLASHMGGIRHYHTAKEGNGGLNSQDEYFSRKAYKSIKESLQMFKDDPLVSEPGTKFEYTTHGYTLLSASLEAKDTNQPFHKQLQQFVQSMAMHDTHLDFNAPILPNRSRYYSNQKQGKRLENVPEVDNSYKWGAGGLLSTVADLLIFANHMLDSYHGLKASILRPETVKTLWTVYAPGSTVPVRNQQDKDGQGNNNNDSGYGMGWVVDNLDLRTDDPQWNRRGYVLHTGGAIGATSVLLIVPNPKGAGGGVCVSVLINQQEAGGVTKLALDIAQHFVPLASSSSSTKTDQQQDPTTTTTTTTKSAISNTKNLAFLSKL